MKTTQEWISEVKSNPEKMRNWLIRQYVGEALAAERIKSLVDCTDSPRFKTVLERIASDERKHTEWVGDLLKVRGINIPEPTYEGTRYWQPILDNLHTFAEIAGAGHHAETMRLIRIRALADDMDFDEDIRNVFSKILPDEEFHAKAFAALSNEEAIEKTRTLHNAGLELLGLEV